MHRTQPNRGLALLITVILTSVLLAISASLINVAIKQFLLSGIARDSEAAFQAATAGIECASYHDVKLDAFDVKPDGTPVSEQTIKCFAESDLDPIDTNITSGDSQIFRFEWGTPSVCTEVSVYKFSENGVGNIDMSTVMGQAATCPRGDAANLPIECTVIKSRGYNTDCATLQNATSNSRIVERELLQRY